MEMGGSASQMRAAPVTVSSESRLTVQSADLRLIPFEACCRLPFSRNIPGSTTRLLSAPMKTNRRGQFEETGGSRQAGATPSRIA